MSLKVVRICDLCKRESPEKQEYFVVNIYKRDPALPHSFEKCFLEVCSTDCVEEATMNWIRQRNLEAKRILEASVEAS